MSALEIAGRPKAVQDFLADLRKAEDSDERDATLRDITGLVQFAQRFYIDFFADELWPKIEIAGFLYRDKRKVAHQLVEYEAMASEGLEEMVEAAAHEAEDLTIAVTELAELFENMVDMLQGDLNFGYSGDIADFREFHNELYPSWLEAVVAWGEAKGEDMRQLEDLAGEYRLDAES
jgi:hypothetical protein